jgi:hypothetical protein
MYYSLIRNNKIELGPRIWSWSAFYDYLIEESLDTSTLPKTAPDQPIVTDDWKILPTAAPTMPNNMNEPFEQLAGPFWTINENDVTGYYDVAPVDIDAIKGILRAKVADNRYKLEIKEFNYNLNGNNVTVNTNREVRNNYFMKYLELDSDETIQWKFNQGWFETSKNDFKNINIMLKNQIQASFDWELQVNQQIDNCTSVDQLKLIETRHSSQIPSDPLHAS